MTQGIDRFFTKMGRFDFSGIAPGGGHAVAIREMPGVPIPPRRRVVVIDMARVAALEAWGQELREKFAAEGQVGV